MILDGKKVSKIILDQAKTKIMTEKIKATLAVIQIGDNEASNVYIKNKQKVCDYVGIHFELYKLSFDTKEETVINLIQKLNQTSRITGIVFQSPPPKTINFDKISNWINSNKDVDGLTKENICNLYHNQDAILPCTVKGILKLLKYYQIPIAGRDVLIIGRGNLVGRPLALALLNQNATVTIAHSQTNDLKSKTLAADLIISATGKPHLITKEMVKPGAIIIDSGFAKVSGQLKGDVDYENVAPVCSYLTPNPGGIGPLTCAMVIENILTLYERKKKNG